MIEVRLSSITEQSINNFCPGNRIVVYGFYDCGYEGVQELFRTANKKVYSWHIGNGYSNEFVDLTENKINGLCLSKKSWIYKNALVHLVLDNYRRGLDCEKITPLVFCIESSISNYPPANVESIFSKKSDLNRLITHKELRRIAKLCFDQRVNPEIRKVALATFKYVRVNVVKDSTGLSREIHLEELPMPFTQSEFDEHYNRRRIGRDAAQVGVSNWRDRLEESRKKIPPPPPIRYWTLAQKVLR